jgi:hypothetical protein
MYHLQLKKNKKKQGAASNRILPRPSEAIVIIIPPTR